jgi:hypothetical protein
LPMQQLGQYRAVGDIGRGGHHGVDQLGAAVDPDGTTEEFRSGQVFAEFGPRSHWVENNGPTPVIFIAANVHGRE